MSLGWQATGSARLSGVVALALAAAPAPQPALSHYALAAPDMTAVLPARLAEVSGVTALSGTEVACIQDEEGIVFVYDLAQRRVVRQIPFGPLGDYEGVASADSRLFVLRSDGVLFEIGGLSGTPRVTAHILRLPTADNEGLCLDAQRRRLLIAPKTRLGKGKAFKDTRAIFAYGLDKAALEPEPVMIVSVDAIRDFAERQGWQAPWRRVTPGGKTRVLRFVPSAIAMHPTTLELFVLSAVDQALATFDASGRVTGVAGLDPALFPQPEGLTFLANGDLVITSEAAGGRPTIALFKRRVQPAR
jgi:hypothetical protein